MKQGKIKFFNETKGFGFIIGDDDGKEIFFHTTQVVGITPSANDRVQYDTQKGNKGLAAIQVEIIN